MEGGGGVGREGWFICRSVVCLAGQLLLRIVSFFFPFMTCFRYFDLCVSALESTVQVICFVVVEIYT